MTSLFPLPRLLVPRIGRTAAGSRPLLLLVHSLVALLLALVPAAPGLAAQDGRVASQLLAAPVNDNLGIDHISYGNGVFSDQRYQFAKQAGVGWNRWVLYWNEIERSPGAYDYSKTDATVAADQAQGFKILGILMGTPDWAADGARTQSLPPPQVGQRLYQGAERVLAQQLSAASNTTLPPRGMDQPVFADGSDVLAPGKAINSNNPWARYVQTTVARYKGRIQAWEIWNEPDFRPTAETGWFGFWGGTVEGYARLLKVAYLTIKATDPDAQVVIGGLAFWFNNNFFPQLLQAVRQDPSAAQNGYYFDKVAWHWYSRASLLYDQTAWSRAVMSRNGISNKGIWITETTLPVCGDPQLKEMVHCTAGSHRGTMDHQAAFIVQALAYAQAAAVERVFIFQLYDDYLGPGEYFGLVRNDGTPRPALTALQTAAAYFRFNGTNYRTASVSGRAELITMLYDSGQRVRVAWNTAAPPLNAAIPIDGASPQTVATTGAVQPLNVAAGQSFAVGLPPATLNDGSATAPDYIVGGPPSIIVENGVSGAWGVLEGRAKDAAGRPLAGVPVRAGGGLVTTDAQGYYRMEILPGLYDVGPGSRSAFPAIAGTSAQGIAVWSGRTTPQDVAVQPASQRFIPFYPSRAGAR